MVPASILSKSSTISVLEMAMIKTHSQAGHVIIKEIDFGYPVEPNSLILELTKLWRLLKQAGGILYDADVVDACLTVFTFGKFQF